MISDRSRPRGYSLFSIAQVSGVEGWKVGRKSKIGKKCGFGEWKHIKVLTNEMDPKRCQS